MKPVRLLLLAAALASSVGATKRDDPTYTLVWKPTSGQEIDYVLSAQISGGGFTVEFLSDFHLKIASVEPDGSYTTESKRSNARIVANGEEKALPSEEGDDKVKVEKYNAKGEKISKDEEDEDDETDEITALLKQTTDFNAPEKPVKKGDTWTKEIKADEKKQVKAAKVTYEVLGESKIGGIDVVQVGMKYKQTEGDHPASFEGTLSFSLKDMSTVELSANVKDAPLDEENLGEIKVKLTRK